MTEPSRLDYLAATIVTVILVAINGDSPSTLIGIVIGVALYTLAVFVISRHRSAKSCPR